MTPGPPLPEVPGAAEWRADDRRGAVAAIGRRMLADPARADLLEGLLALARHRWRAGRAGKAPGMAVLGRPARATLSRLTARAGAAGGTIRFPAGTGPAEVLSHPCDLLVICAPPGPETQQAALLWALFWGARIVREEAAAEDAAPSPLPAPARLWADPAQEAAFRAAGGWHRLAGAPVPAAPPLRAPPRAPRVLLWSVLSGDDPLPRLADPVAGGPACILFADRPVAAPAPWEVRVLPDPQAARAEPARFLPPHDLALFLPPGHRLPPGDPARLALLPPGSAPEFPPDPHPARPGPAVPLPPRRGFARQIADWRPTPVADVTVLTPTGDRLAAFARCAWLVQSQTLRPARWLIVDDGAVPVGDAIPLPDFARVIRRPRRPDDPPHTLSANLAAALPHVPPGKVVMMEDDDWYAPDYLATMVAALDGADLAGLNHIHYYHLRGHGWKTGTPPTHTALAQTAFRRETAGAALARLCADPPDEVRALGVVDRHWWQGFDGTKRLLRDHPLLHLGLKGGFGRAGLASGHDAAEPDYIADPGAAKLVEFLGPDLAFYDRLRRPPGGPDDLAVYAAVAEGGPPPPPPPAALAGCDPVLFSHDPDITAPGWRVLPLDERCAQPWRDADKPAVLPHLHFPDRDLSLWLGPAAAVAGVPAASPEEFRRDPGALLRVFAPGGGPVRGLLRRHNDPRVMRAMLDWWRAGGNAGPPGPLP